MTVLLWVVKLLGLKKITRLSLGIIAWTLRLALLAGLVGLGIVLWPRVRDAFSDENLQLGAVVLAAVAALALAFVGFRWLRRRQGYADAGERTIDGKRVPNMLAASALAVPARSPDAGYVLRGLPPFGKVLLKLDAYEFEYEPEPPAPVLALPAPEKPRVKRGWFALPLKLALTGAALLLVGGLWQGWIRLNKNFVFYANRFTILTDILVRQAKSGDTTAIGRLGNLTMAGNPKAAHYLLELAESGNPKAMGTVADVLDRQAMRIEFQGRKEDAAKTKKNAAEWYQKAAYAGDVKSMLDLGLSYRLGDGVPRIPSLAIEWFSKAAAANDAMAMNILAGLYAQGRAGIEGITKDDAAAVRLYRRSAENAHNAEGMYFLGTMYEKGRGGLPKDIDQAVSWYQKAAENDNGGARNVAVQALGRLGYEAPPTKESWVHNVFVWGPLWLALTGAALVLIGVVLRFFSYFRRPAAQTAASGRMAF